MSGISEFFSCRPFGAVPPVTNHGVCRWVSVTENSPAGLFLLKPDVSVTVTREEHHQQAFARYPVVAGMSRRVAVELTWCDIGSGKYKGERAIEVRLDGYRVGELTYAMSQRYGPIVDEVAGRGRLAGCEGLIFLGKRGTEIQLLLPDPTSTIPMPRPSMAVAVAPQVAVSTPATARAKPGRGIFARHKPAWIAGGVVGVILIASIAGQEKTAPSADSPITRATATATVPSTTTSTTTSTTASSSTAAVPSSSVESPVAPVAPPPPATKAAAPPKTTSSPKPPTSAPKPPPPPKPVTTAPPQGNCDANYSGCVPVAEDVDCAGGSGNGPAYVRGPIRVIGNDIYGLDNDHDGIACE
jgi:hypothetical protein